MKNFLELFTLYLILLQVVSDIRLISCYFATVFELYVGS